MVDLREMLEWAAKLRALDDAGADDEATVDYLEAAAAELSEWRRPPTPTGSVDLDAMAQMLGRIRVSGGTFDNDGIATMIAEAAGELAARRGGAGTSGEDRRLYWLGVFAPLVWTNAARVGMSHVLIAVNVVSMADAMLAAERAPKGGDHG